MLIPLTDPKNEYSAQMLRLIGAHSHRSAVPDAAHAVPAPEVERVHEARARTIVTRLFARRATAAASNSI